MKRRIHLRSQHQKRVKRIAIGQRSQFTHLAFPLQRGIYNLCSWEACRKRLPYFVLQPFLLVFQLPPVEYMAEQQQTCRKGKQDGAARKATRIKGKTPDTGLAPAQHVGASYRAGQQHPVRAQAHILLAGQQADRRQRIRQPDASV